MGVPVLVHVCEHDYCVFTQEPCIPHRKPGLDAESLGLDGGGNDDCCRRQKWDHQHRFPPEQGIC